MIKMMLEMRKKDRKKEGKKERKNCIFVCSPKSVFYI
jgi:hypothetical protein